jgi:DNA-binding transcriptional ArsR family regulator
MSNITVRGLVKKRAEISGRIHALQEEAARLVAALDHIDQTIRLFDPEIDFQDMPVKLLPPPNAAFRGEFQRSLLDMLRGTQRWQTTDELAVKVMVQRRMNEADRGLRILTRKRVGHALKRLERKGITESRRMGKGALLSWRITKPDAQLEGGWRNGSEANGPSHYLVPPPS